MAAQEHESGKYVAKPVIVKADGKNIMCVLAANHKVDLRKLKGQLGADSVELANEEQLGEIFNDSIIKQGNEKPRKAVSRL